MEMMSFHFYLALALFAAAYKTTDAISTPGCTSDIKILKNGTVAQQLESYLKNEMDIIEIHLKTNTCIALINDDNTISNKTFASASPIEKYNMFIYFIVTNTGRTLMQYPADADTLTFNTLGSQKALMDVDVMLYNHDCALNTGQLRTIFLQGLSTLTPITNNGDISVCNYEVSEKDWRLYAELLFLPYYTYNNFKTFCLTGGVVAEIPQALPNILLRWLCVALHLTLPIGFFFIPHSVHDKTDLYRKCDVPFSVSMLLSYITYWAPSKCCCCCIRKDCSKCFRKHPLLRQFIFISFISFLVGLVIHQLLREANALENDLVVLSGSSAFYYFYEINRGKLSTFLWPILGLSFVCVLFYCIKCCINRCCCCDTSSQNKRCCLKEEDTSSRSKCCCLFCLKAEDMSSRNKCCCLCCLKEEDTSSQSKWCCPCCLEEEDMSSRNENTTMEISYPIYFLRFDYTHCPTKCSNCKCHSAFNLKLKTDRADFNTTIKMVSEVICSPAFWCKLLKDSWLFLIVINAPFVVILCIPYINNCISSVIEEYKHLHVKPKYKKTICCLIIIPGNVLRLALTVVLVNITLIQTATLVLQVIILTLFVGIPFYPKLIAYIILLTGFIKYVMQAILQFQHKSKHVLDEIFKADKYKDKDEIPKELFSTVLKQCSSVSFCVVVMKIVAIFFVWFTAYVAIKQGPKGLSAWKDVFPTIVLFIGPDWLSKFIYNEAADNQYIEQCVRRAMETLELHKNMESLI